MHEIAKKKTMLFLRDKNAPACSFIRPYTHSFGYVRYDV